MSTATRTRAWCDVCLAQGEKVEAQHVRLPVSINRSRSQVVELCDEHYELLLQPLLQVLMKPEAPTSRTRGRRYDRRTGPFLCQVRDCGAILKHTGTLWQHLQGRHELTIAEYREKYGDPVPLTPEEVAGTVVEAKCRVKGCGQVYSTELGHRFPQSALASHMWGRHGIKERA